MNGQSQFPNQMPNQMPGQTPGQAPQMPQMPPQLPPQSNFKRWLPTIVGIIIVVLLGGGILGYQYRQKPNVSPEPEAIPTTEEIPTEEQPTQPLPVEEEVKTISKTYLETCIDKWEVKKLYYEPYALGGLIVGFKKGITETEAIDLIKSYNLGLSPKPTPFNSWLSIEVPEGKEIDWLCILEENRKVEYVELILIVSAH